MAELAFNSLVASAFTMGFSMPVGRAFLAIAAILWFVDLWQSRRVPELSGVMWLAIAFFLAAIVSTMHGVDPAGTASKLKKLPWYFGILVYAQLVTSPWRLTVVLGAFAAGTGLLALWNVIADPIMALQAEGVSFGRALRDAGSMADAQRLMAGMLAAVALLMIARNVRRRHLGWVALLAIQAMALLMSGKRGSWISLVLVVGAVLALKGKWRYVLGVAGAVLLIALLPPVRNRLANLGSELDIEKGGRLTMWFKVAPKLHGERPWLGIGWRAMTPEMMQKIDSDIEDNRNHLHSNLVEILVATGWIGFAIYLAWMVKALWDTAVFYFGARKKTAEEEYNSLALLSILIALMLNGLVEFNFGDAEIVLVYAMVIGCAVAGQNRLESRPLGIRLQVH